MIKVSAFYPNKDGTAFNMDYYLNNHIPMVQRLVGDACKGMSVEIGMAGVGADSKPTYVAMGHLLFDSVEAFQSAFIPHFKAIAADMPNYAQVQPVVQISEVKLG